MNKDNQSIDIPTILEILNNGFCYPDCLFDFQIENSPEAKKELDLFTCPICSSIFNEPCIDNCNPPHTFGRPCISLCLEKKTECPLSRQLTIPINLRKIPTIFQYFHDRMRMKCLFFGYGCAWIGEICQLRNHITQNCLFSFLIKTEISVTDVWDLEKMPKYQLEKITILQSDIDMLNFPLKSSKELSLIGEFTNLRELSLDFKYHSFDNHHKEFLLLNVALNSLLKLEKLSLTLINRFVECVNEFNFLYWFDIANDEVNIQELVNWKGLKDEALDIILNKTFEMCKDLKIINLNFSFNGFTAEGLSKLLEKISKLKKLSEVFLDFSNQKELKVKKGEKLNGKKALKNCFSKINLEKNLGFLFFTKKTLREISTKLFGNKLKMLIL